MKIINKEQMVKYRVYWYTAMRQEKERERQWQRYGDGDTDTKKAVLTGYYSSLPQFLSEWAEV